MKSLSLLVVAALAMTACNKNDGKSGAASTVPAPQGTGVEGANKTMVSAALLGRWTFGCERMENGPGSYRSDLVFKEGGALTTEAQRFESNDCSGEGVDPITLESRFTANLNNQLEGTVRIEAAEDKAKNAAGTRTTAAVKIEGGKLKVSNIDGVNIKDGQEVPLTAEEKAPFELTKVE